MSGTVITSIAAYISTNIDDIFVLMLLLSQASKRGRRQIVAGHFLGVGIITAVSMLGAVGLQSVPMKYVGILGLVPIALGIRAWKSKDDDAVNGENVGLLSMAVITLGNGGDNFGVYIPLFTGFSGCERLWAAGVFAGMTAVWVLLAGRLASLPKVRAVIAQYKHIAVPLLFIALGIYIILDSGLFG